MGFFRRLFGLETPDEKLQRRLQEQKNKIVEILRKDGRANEDMLKQIESELFTPDKLIKIINDLVATKILKEDIVEELNKTKQETTEIMSESGITNTPESAKVDGDIVDVIQEEPKTNAGLLAEITNNLSNMINEISDNNKRIALMENKLKVLKQNTDDINQVISELRIKMDNTDDLKEKEELINQIQELEKDKELIDASADSIRRKIGQIQQLVAEQSAQLVNFQQGSGRDEMKKINRMTRKDLDRAARALNLTPSHYKTKKDIQDAVKLMTVARRLPLQRLDKQRLSIISQNYDITSKSKRGMLEGLKKYKLIK